MTPVGSSSSYVILLSMGKTSTNNTNKSRVEADRIMEEFWVGLKELGIKKKLKSSELKVINAYL